MTWFDCSSEFIDFFGPRYKVNQMKTIQFDRVINDPSNHTKIKNFWSLADIQYTEQKSQNQRDHAVDSSKCPLPDVGKN